MSFTFNGIGAPISAGMCVCVCNVFGMTDDVETAHDTIIDVAAGWYSGPVGSRLVRDAPDPNKREVESSDPSADERGQDVQGDCSPSPSQSTDKTLVVARVHDPGFLNMLLGTATTGLATVGRTLYDTISDQTNRFAERVRKIIIEESYNLMAKSMTKIKKAMFTQGELKYNIITQTATA